MRIQALVGCSIALLHCALPAVGQTVRVQFSSEVASMSGALLSGVTTGSVITGEVTVDLAHLPPDVHTFDSVGEHSYGGHGLPGYIFQFTAGGQTYTFDSVNAASGPGMAPGFFLHDFGPSLESVYFQARSSGIPFVALLQFEDVSDPYTLLRGDYFPEDLDLSVIPDRARLIYAAGNFGEGVDRVLALITSLTMTIELPTPASLLIYRVKASNLSERQKRALLRILERADAAFAEGRCKLGQKRLRNFQQAVRAGVRKHDPVLAAHLIEGAENVQCAP